MDNMPARHANAFDLVASQPWAITGDMLKTISAIARRENDSVEAVQARLGRPLQNARSVTMRGDVAVIPVTGPVFRYGNLFTEVSGATSLEVLAKDHATALDNPAVKTIVLYLDTPGGQANGIAEFAQMVRESGKQVIAYVANQAASAGYWIAAAAHRVVMSKTAMVGSIGAVISIDPRRSEGAIEIVSSQSPNKRVDVTTDAGRQQVQAMIDGLAQVFVDDVAKYRGVSSADVIAKFGGGGMFLAAEAVALGMADEVGTFEGLIAGLSGATARKGVSRMAEGTGAPAAEMPEINREYLAANHAALVSALLAEGASAERERVLGIQAAALPGHDALVAQLIDEGASVEASALRIMQAEKSSLSSRVAAMRADAPQALPFVADNDVAEAADAPKKSARELAAEIAAKQAEAAAKGQTLSAPAALALIKKEAANG